MPELYIVAGPNGTGKTTWYNAALEEGYIDANLAFLNADSICRDELGGYSIENAAQAEVILRERIEQHLKDNTSFMIESNLAVQADYDWIDKMKARGYATHLYFLCTSDVEINVRRVQKRVAEGGHPVSAAIVRQRFNNGLMYLKGKLHTFNEAILIDNSEDEPKKVVAISNGHIIIKEDPCPVWAKGALYIIEKLANR